MNTYNVAETKDGSYTVTDKQTGENFHSTFGAITESNHIFIKNGLNIIKSNEIHILEIGFGTGLNCLLTLINQPPQSKIFYHAIEKYPLSQDIYKKLNYSKILNISNDSYNNLLNADWNKQIKITDSFQLYKINSDLLNFTICFKYDLIYFDAFSPNVQPELWTKEIFNKLNNCLSDNGILITYSSKGIVKQALREAGFLVKRISGPKGKRHIVRAIKQSNNN